MAYRGQQQLQDVQPVRDTFGAYSPDLHGFFGVIESKQYKVIEVIGRGSYGVVCAALDTLTGEKVAIKKIQNVFENVADATRILREIKLLRLLKHPDVVDIKHIMLPPDARHFKDIYVVFELLESDLHTVIGANDDLTQDHHKVFLYQLLRGLNFIHASGVLHRDLKPKNILANSNCKLKICDFGLARPFWPEQSMTPVFWTDYVATRWYRAPELCGCFYGRYSQAVDIWSLGCIFAEVLTGKPLFPGRDVVGQLQLITDLLGKPSPAVIDRITNIKARKFLTDLPPKEPRSFEAKFPMADRQAIDLLRRLLAFDPSDRPTAEAALSHPYFAGLPLAVCTEPARVGTDDFGFEAQKLSEAQVRQHIYTEILSYHPKAQALFDSASRCPPGQPPLYAPLPHDDYLRGQFLIAEQQQQQDLAATAAAAAAAAAVAQRQQQQHQQYHPAVYAGGGHYPAAAPAACATTPVRSAMEASGVWGSGGGASTSSQQPQHHHHQYSPMEAVTDTSALLQMQANGYYHPQQQQQAAPLQGLYGHPPQQQAHLQQQQQQQPLYSNGGSGGGYQTEIMPSSAYGGHPTQSYGAGSYPLCI